MGGRTPQTRSAHRTARAGGERGVGDEGVGIHCTVSVLLTSRGVWSLKVSPGAGSSLSLFLLSARARARARPRGGLAITPVYGVRTLVSICACVCVSFIINNHFGEKKAGAHSRFPNRCESVNTTHTLTVSHSLASGRPDAARVKNARGWETQAIYQDGCRSAFG